MKITPIIAVRDDREQLKDTINSLLQTSPCSIMLVDDCSEDGSVDLWDGHPRVKVHYCPMKLGCPPARHIGASLIEDGWLLFTDSHMIYPHGWYEIASQFIHDSPLSDCFCSVYVAHNKITGEDVHMAGSDISWIKRNRNANSGFSLVPQSPRPFKPESYPLIQVPTMLGACYLIHKHWYDYTRGFDGLIGWGGSEQLMSLKTWIMGGRVNVIRDLHVRHIKQDDKKSANYLRNPHPALTLNRLRIMNLFMGNDLFYEFVHELPPNGLLLKSLKLLEQKPEWEWLQTTANAIANKAKISLEELWNKVGLPNPRTMIDEGIKI